MLVLGRSVGERVVIGDNEIIIEVLEVRGRTCRLGFTAPRDTAINRQEIYESKKASGSPLDVNSREAR